MKGSHQIIISNKRIKYQFSINRNITIIKGNSATGKTTLIEMLEEYHENGTKSAINFSCDKPCRVLSGKEWKAMLNTMKDSIVFIDEGNEFVFTKEFSTTIQNTDNYYVIVTREAIPTLPYSVKEIYGIRVSGKYGTLKQTYNEFYNLYNAEEYTKTIRPDIVITEDSNSGHQFFKDVCEKHDIDCYSANGKSNVFAELEKNSAINKGKTVVIADGAAFGPEMEKVMNFLYSFDNVTLYLPESFEWLILNSDVISDTEIKDILKNPSEYIECGEYFSWERFFTNLLIEKTNGTYLQYTKKNINDAYLNDKISSKIVKSIKSIDFLSRNVGVESDNVGVEVTLTEQNILLCLKSNPS